MTSPLQELAHDHRELSVLLVAVHEALARIERGASRVEDELHEMSDGMEAFREALLEHFAHEQEGVLPWIARRLPEVQARIDGLVAEHDRIAETLTAVVRELGGLDATTGMSGYRDALARFDALYAQHSQSEVAFFRDVTVALAGDAAATDQLRALLADP